MKVTLQIRGHEMTFSENELISILEEHFESSTTGLPKSPKEGQWFQVNPETIDRQLFNEYRKDVLQENIRQTILQAFSEVDKNPEAYGKPFRTMAPEKTWTEMTTIFQAEKVASFFGGHIANWVEQALEWAQRINNGETWERVCNEKDDSNWYRLVRWKDERILFVGHASKNRIISEPASTTVLDLDRIDAVLLTNSVPLVVRRK